MPPTSGTTCWTKPARSVCLLCCAAVRQRRPPPAGPRPESGCAHHRRKLCGPGGQWSCWSSDAAAQSALLPLAAVLCWAGDFLAYPERRALQACPEAVRLAGRWQADLASPFARPADSTPQPASPAARLHRQRQCPAPWPPAVQNPRGRAFWPCWRRCKKTPGALRFWLPQGSGRIVFIG